MAMLKCSVQWIYEKEATSSSVSSLEVMALLDTRACPERTVPCHHHLAWNGHYGRARPVELEDDGHAWVRSGFAHVGGDIPRNK